MDRTEIPVAEDNDAGGSGPLTDTSPQASVNEGFTFKRIKFGSGFELSKVQSFFRNIQIDKAKAYEKSFESPEIQRLIRQREIAKAKLYERFAHVKPLNGLRGITYCNDPDPASFEIIRREDRKRRAKRFRNLYIYGTTPDGPCTIPSKTERIKYECFQIQNSSGTIADGCTKPFAGTREKRICIGSKDHCFWEEKSSGIMWVCVHGMDSVCVVTRSGDLDWRRVRSGLRWTDVGTVLSYFRISIISEIEDLVDTPSEPLNMIIEKPFGVVCVPDTTDIHNECGHEGSSIGYDVGKAKKFLEDKMTSETSFTVIETIQTAISAFQHLLQKKFKANEIEIITWNCRGTGSPEFFRNLKDLVKTHKPDILCLVETRES